MNPTYQTEGPDHTEVGHLSNTSARSGKKSAQKNPSRTKYQNLVDLPTKAFVESVLWPKLLYRILNSSFAQRATWGSESDITISEQNKEMLFLFLPSSGFSG
jgi:hypothetical protein